MALSRRDFLARLGAAGTLASVPAWAEAAGERLIPWRNWSGAQTCLPAARVAPESEEALAGLVRATKTAIRPVGSSHSFSALVPTDGTLVSLGNLSGMIGHDPATRQAEFWGGTVLSTMGEPLKDVGQALPNMSDIDYQTLAGATATSSHGTGVKFGSYSAYIAGLRLVTAKGEILDCDATKNPAVFAAARASLGALGVVTRLRLQNRKAFRLHSKPWMQKTEELLDDIGRLAQENDHFEIMPLVHCDWSIAIAHNETDAPYAPKQEPEGDTQLAGLMDSVYRHLREYPKLRATLVNFIASKLDFEEDVDDSYKVFANVRDVRFHEMEYTVPAEAGPACLREILKKIRDEQLPSWFPMEYRYVKADDVPLSMFSGRDGCSISVQQYYTMDYHNYFAAIEPIFWKYEGRPHWGKLHTLNAAQLSKLYPRWKEFLEVREHLDPAGKFLNGHLRSVFGL